MPNIEEECIVLLLFYNRISTYIVKKIEDGEYSYLGVTDGDGNEIMSLNDLKEETFGKVILSPLP
jgi:hypothetical protein